MYSSVWIQQMINLMITAHCSFVVFFGLDLIGWTDFFYCAQAFSLCRWSSTHWTRKLKSSLAFHNVFCMHNSQSNFPFFFSDFGWKRVLVRSAVLATIVFVAETVPSFGPVLDFFGGSAMALNSFVFPSVFYLFLAAGEQKAKEKEHYGCVEPPTFREWVFWKKTLMMDGWHFSRMVQRTKKRTLILCGVVIGNRRFRVREFFWYKHFFQKISSFHAGRLHCHILCLTRNDQQWIHDTMLYADILRQPDEHNDNNNNSDQLLRPIPECVQASDRKSLAFGTNVIVIEFCVFFFNRYGPSQQQCAKMDLNFFWWWMLDVSAVPFIDSLLLLHLF